MPFASPTAQKIGRYLGYPAGNSSQQAIAAALSAIETMTNGIYSNAAIATGLEIYTDTSGASLV
jgi:hypothetical protein